MRYLGNWHVFYSGCFDNTPKEPDYYNEYYQKFDKKSNASIYAHGLVRQIDAEYAKEGYVGVEYGVCQVPQVFTDCRGGKYYKDIEETFRLCKPLLDTLAEKRLYVKDLQPLLKRVEDLEKFKDKFICKMDYYDLDTICDQLHEHDRYIRMAKIEHPKPRDDGCFQFTYCNECLAFPMGIDCPNLVKGPVQLKDEIKKKEDSEGWRDCKECELYGECDHQGAYQKDGKWCYEDSGGEKEIIRTDTEVRDLLKKVGLVGWLPKNLGNKDSKQTEKKDVKTFMDKFRNLGQTASGGEKDLVPLVVDSEKELNESDSADEKLPEPIDCYDCPRREGNYCHFYLCTTALAKRNCTICITCKNANWINSFYKECEGCIIKFEQSKEKLPEPLINSDLETVFPKEKTEPDITFVDPCEPGKEPEKGYIIKFPLDSHLYTGVYKKGFVDGMEYQNKELIEEFIEKLVFICYNMENRNWENIDKLIEEYKERVNEPNKEN